MQTKLQQICELLNKAAFKRIDAINARVYATSLAGDEQEKAKLYAERTKTYTQEWTDIVNEAFELYKGCNEDEKIEIVKRVASTIAAEEAVLKINPLAYKPIGLRDSYKMLFEKMQPPKIKKGRK